MRARIAVFAAATLSVVSTLACTSRDSPSHIPEGSAVGNGSTSGSAPTSTSTSGAMSSASGSGTSGGEPAPQESAMPVPYGTCASLINGQNTLNITGLPARTVEVRYSAANQTKNGPLVILWHGDEQTPKAALEELLGSTSIAKILDAGGMVAAPSHDPMAQNAVWFSSQGDFTNDDDFVVLDQLVACSREQIGIDTRHIHLIGYQSGGFQATHAAVLRSGYVASVVVHSGGLAGAPLEQAINLAYPFMILHGGKTLDVAAKAYGASSIALAKLTAQGGGPFTTEHFTVLCDHASGATIATDALPATYAFLMAHPFGNPGSPYAQGLPSAFPSFCQIAE